MHSKEVPHFLLIKMWHLKKHGMDEDQLSNTLEFLDALHMLIFYNKKWENFMTKKKNINAFFLVLVSSQKHTNYTILSPRKLYLVVMWFLMKKCSRNGMKTMLNNKYELILMEKMKIKGINLWRMWKKMKIEGINLWRMCNPWRMSNNH